MLVLVATNETQGQSSDDYSYTVAGELVTAVVTECESKDCGCGRGFPGLASAFATTTAQVVDLPHLTDADLRGALYDYLARGGWLDLLRDEPDVEMIIEDMIDEHVDGHRRGVCPLPRRHHRRTTRDRWCSPARSRSPPDTGATEL